jgi:hypothetical protein
VSPLSIDLQCYRAPLSIQESTTTTTTTPDVSQRCLGELGGLLMTEAAVAQRRVLASLKGYGTANFQPGREFGDEQPKAVQKSVNGVAMWSCPWTCYQILVRRPVSQPHSEIQLLSGADSGASAAAAQRRPNGTAPAQARGKGNHSPGSSDSKPASPAAAAAAAAQCKRSKETQHASCHITGYARPPHNDEAQLMEAVRRQPVAVSIDASALHSYHSGVLPSGHCEGGNNHAVLAGGFGTDSEGGDYWLVKNSCERAFSIFDAVPF